MTNRVDGRAILPELFDDPRLFAFLRSFGQWKIALRHHKFYQLLQSRARIEPQISIFCAFAALVFYLLDL